MVFTSFSLARRDLNRKLHQVLFNSFIPLPQSLHQSALYNLVLLSPHSLDILARKDRVVINSALLRGDVGVGVCIELLGLGCEVEVDGVRPGESEEDEGDAHGVSGADFVGDVAENDGDDGSTADGRDEEGGTALGVATETAERKSEDDWKDAGLNMILVNVPRAVEHRNLPRRIGQS